MKSLKYLAVFLVFLAPMNLRASSEVDALQTVKSDNKAIWSPASDAQQSTYNAVSLSMLGWGIGLAIGIIILSSSINASTASD